jgi:hypothetical protein
MILMLITAAAALGLAPQSPTKACLAAERADDTIFCSPKNGTFVLVGRTTGKNYSVYDYRYRFLPHPGGVMHGGQRLIVFLRDRYVGQYNLQPAVSVAVDGSQVVLKGDDDKKAVRLDFSRRPPAQILVNGEVEGFAR